MILVFIWLFIIIFSTLLFIRNGRVLRFNLWIIETFLKPSEDLDFFLKKVAIYGKVKYSRMLFSFKRLEIDNFWSKEDCETLNTFK